jgi:hypothetical protein
MLVNQYSPFRRSLSNSLTAMALLVVTLGIPNSTLQAAELHLGPLFDEFDLTLTPGTRKEALGPLFYSEHRDTETIWALPPLFAHAEDTASDYTEYDVLYPLLTYDRFGEQYRWQLFQLLSWAGGPTQEERERRRFSLFPVYLTQRSSDPAENYTSIFPFYGHLRNRMFRDEIYYVMFPFYGQSRKKDVVTDNYVYPFYHVRHGNGLFGKQFWPFAGHEHKEITTETNGFGDVRIIPGHDRRFIMGPFYFNETNGIGTDNPEWQRGSLPAFALLRSPKRDSTTVIWPFFSVIDDREKKYHERQTLWPLIIRARGPGKTADRVLPFFSKAYSPELESDSYMWPVYKRNRIHSDPLDRERIRILLFLYSDTVQKNTETKQSQRRTDLWPLFARRRDYNGDTRLQVLAPLEIFMPNVKSIDRDYSQLWSVWRVEKSPDRGAASQSLFWNLYRRETWPDRKKCSLLFGLFQYESDSESKRLRVFYVPLKKQQTSGTIKPR